MPTPAYWPEATAHLAKRDKVLRKLIKAYPFCAFSVTADHPTAVRALSETMRLAKQSVEVILDLDVGQHRTGIPAGEEARELYQLIGSLPGLRPGGFHVYLRHYAALRK